MLSRRVTEYVYVGHSLDVKRQIVEMVINARALPSDFWYGLAHFYLVVQAQKVP
jgi:hypothetical protein